MMRSLPTAGLLLIASLAACSQNTGDEADIAASICLDPADGSRVTIPGGNFTMGENPRYPEEGPPRNVTVPDFAIDAHEVTNAQFAAFVDATGYETVAERPPPIVPGAPAEMSEPGSAVFHTPDANDRRWWRWVPGANWRHPEGPDSSIEGRDNLPVVQIAYEDALAYADWAGGTLPNEAQWEYAARADAPANTLPVDQDGAPTANFYQGVFPQRDLGEDGYRTRAPVGCFAPNSHGLYDMIGNVWEWTADPDRRAPGSAVIKGGSFLCAANYCARYRPAARQFQERGLGANHIGFRLVYPPETG